ncbi:la-related protein 4b [Limosa lapponica baueri]|uniref:La-related protein 4b n=1 Tax=Limosa lapponica baueri TaxID=1758121 RepID=A0A2I0U2M1_LIMLA|nr:la-related protein 4b [Limosa lapponica baueri]
MGCCFSKELSNSTNEEKTSLLQKSVEEEAPESRISKTLSPILGTVESQDLHTVGRTVNGAAAIVGIERVRSDDCAVSNSKSGFWDRKAKYPSYKSMENTPCESSRRTYDRPFSFFNSFSHLLKVSGTYGNLQKSEEKKDKVIKKRAPKKCNSNGQHMNNTENINSNINNENVAAEERCLFDSISTTHVPDVLDKGLQGEIPLNRNFLEDYAVTCDHSRQNETTINVEDSKSDSLQKVSSSHREMSPTFSYLDVDNRQNTKDREFYSICVVDAEDLKGDEEVAATGHEETADVDNSAVTDEGMCSMARPLDTGEEFPMQQSAQVEAKFNSQKELFEYKEEDRSNMQKNETKEYCSIDIQSSYGNLLANRCEVHRLNTDNAVTDGLRVKVYNEVVPENQGEEVCTIGDAVSWNESLHRACDSVKFVDAAEEDPYSPNSENTKHGDCVSSALLNTGVCNSGQTEGSHDSENVPFGLSRHPSSVVREINTQQREEDVSGNFKLTLGLHEMDNDSFLVSQHVEKLDEDSYFLKPESEANSSVEKRTYQRTHGDSQATAPDSSEHHSVTEEFLKDKEECTGTVLPSCEALNISEIDENLEEGSDFQTQIKGCTENKTSTEVANNSGKEQDVSVSTIELKGDTVEEADSLIRTRSWVSDGTLISHELNNTSTDEIFVKENSLESQISQESPGNKGKVCKCSNSDKKTSVSSVSVEHEDMNKMDTNYRQDEEQDACSFHAVENQWNAGTDPAKIAGDVAESVEQIKFEVHLNETIDNKAENVKQNLDANIVGCDKNILNSSKGSTHDQNTYSDSAVPVALDNDMHKSVKLIDDTKNLEDNSSLLHKAHNCLPALCQNSYSHVCDKPVEEPELCHCTSPEPEAGNTQVSVGPFTEVGAEAHEKRMCDVNECNLQDGEVKQCFSVHSEEENLTGFSMSTGNLEAFTTGNLKQLEAETTELKNTSYILNTQMNDLTTSWEQMQSDHKIFSNKELGVFVDPEQVDKYAATPSYEIQSASPGAAGFQRGSERRALDLMEHTSRDPEHAYELDRQNPQVEMWSHFISLQAGNADWTNQLFSDAVPAGNGEYLMGFLWNNAISNDTMKNDRLCMISESFQNEPEDLTGASYAVERYPYQLLAPENIGTWGWQDKDDFVSILQK